MRAVETHNGGAIEPPGELPVGEFQGWLAEAVAAGGRVVALLGTGTVPDVGLLAVVADDGAGSLGIARSRADGPEIPSLTPAVTQVHLFEREIREQTGLVPAGHPWLKPLRYTRAGDAAGVTEFYRVEGESVHEVGVGPVHAGVIEPGHFRFQCHGERVFHLEISLGYQHRGVERALAAGPAKRALHYAETLAGDTTVGHATAHCEVLESLAGVRVPPRAQAIRAVALELERLANHVGDLGALAGDVAFLPTASFCGRIRGEFLNMTAALCGSRFGRGLVVPGGTGFAVDAGTAAGLAAALAAAEDDTAGAVELLWGAPSATGRFEGTGAVPTALARELGLVGPAARASGLHLDARHDHPSGLFRMVQVPVSVAGFGDVHARAWIRWLECRRSAAFVREQLACLPGGPVRVPMGPLAPGRLAVSLVEGWRGEIAHVAGTDGEGRIALRKVVDPSFHNWPALAMAMRGQAISDFPICNKSFNLSYCGFDL